VFCGPWAKPDSRRTLPVWRAAPATLRMASRGAGVGRTIEPLAGGSLAIEGRSWTRRPAVTWAIAGPAWAASGG
jgi:hypothetical protein